MRPFLVWKNMLKPLYAQLYVFPSRVRLSMLSLLSPRIRSSEYGGNWRSAISAPQEKGLCLRPPPSLH